MIKTIDVDGCCWDRHFGGGADRAGSVSVDDYRDAALLPRARRDEFVTVIHQ